MPCNVAISIAMPAGAVSLMALSKAVLVEPLRKAPLMARIFMGDPDTLLENINYCVIPDKAAARGRRAGTQYSRVPESSASSREAVDFTGILGPRSSLRFGGDDTIIMYI